MHEAGHVVAALALGFGVKFAILHQHEDARRQGTSGYTEVTLDFAGRTNSAEEAVAATMTPEALRIRTMQGLAGRVAESSVNANEEDLDQGAAGDDKRVWAFAMRALGPVATSTAWTHWLNDRHQETVAMMTPLWPAVVRVANHLIEHANEEVPGGTLKRLMLDSPNTADPVEVKRIVIDDLDDPDGNIQ